MHNFEHLGFKALSTESLYTEEGSVKDALKFADIAGRSHSKTIAILDYLNRVLDKHEFSAIMISSNRIEDFCYMYKSLFNEEILLKKALDNKFYNLPKVGTASDIYIASKK